MELALPGDDEGAELWMTRFCDGQVKSEKGESFAERVYVRNREFELREAAALRRGGGGVRGIRGPSDKEWQEAGLVVGEVERLPSEKLTIGTLAGAGDWAGEGDASGMELGRKGGEVVGVSGPADELRAGESFEMRDETTEARQEWRHVLVALIWVGRDDFKVMAIAEGKQCVLGAAPGVDATECGSNAGRDSTKAMPSLRSRQPRRMWSRVAGTGSTPCAGNENAAAVAPAVKRKRRRVSMVHIMAEMAGRRGVRRGHRAE